MLVHPDIAALRGDRAPQRHAQEAVLAARRAWSAEAGAGAMLAELETYGAGAPLEACPALEAVFTGGGEAERLMGLLSRHFCTAIAANPIGHPPFRAGFNGTATSILLARTGRAQLLLQAREPGKDGAESLLFSDATRFDAVLAGEAEARIVRIIRRTDDRITSSEERVALRAGQRLAFDLTGETLLVDAVQRRLVVLRLLRSAAEPQPSREYCAGSGKLLRQSAGAIATSRQEAMVALLGRMGRTDAAPTIAALATSGDDPSLRWQALREALALDTATGFAALCRLARRVGDPLAADAGALRAQLLETYPELRQLEDDQCPV